MLLYISFGVSDTKIYNVIIFIFVILTITIIVRICEYGIPEKLKICFSDCVFGNLENHEDEN